jgi:hypothetical protein
MAAAGTAEWAAAAAEGAPIAVLEGDHKGRAGIIYGVEDEEGFVMLDDLPTATEWKRLKDPGDLQIVNLDDLINLDALGERQATAEEEAADVEAAVRTALRQAPWLQEQRRQRQRQQRQQEQREWIRRQEQKQEQEWQRARRRRQQRAQQEQQEQHRPRKAAAAKGGWSRGQWPPAGTKAATGATGGWGRKK